MVCRAPAPRPCEFAAVVGVKLQEAESPVRRWLRRQYRRFRPTPIPVCDHETRRVLMATLRPNSNTVDVGCNRGSILREILQLSPNGRHFAFEPIPSLFVELCRRFPGVECHGIALSD